MIWRKIRSGCAVGLLAFGLAAQLHAQPVTSRSSPPPSTAADRAALAAEQVAVLEAALAQAKAQPVSQLASPSVQAPLAAGQATVQQAVLTAAQQADYSNNYAPWTIPLVFGGGAPVTGEAMQTQAAGSLLALATNLAAMQAAQHAAVSNLLRSQTNAMPQSWTNSQGNHFFFDHLDENGNAVVKMTHNFESVQTVGAQKLWLGGGAGFNLNGSNVMLAQWDDGDVLTNHQEFVTGGKRAYLIDGPTTRGIQDHPTHVAGTMMAYGVTNTAIGFANRARLAEGYMAFDMAEMPLQAATNNVHESNHSYGYATGWIPMDTQSQRQDR